MSVLRLTPSERLIVALNVDKPATAYGIATSLRGVCKWLKVGHELYIKGGPALVQELRKLGFSVFYDLKIHEIPNSVRGAVRSAASAGFSMITVHASGGAEMMAVAMTEARSLANEMIVLAVTVPTHMDREQLRGLGLDVEPMEQVCRLASLAAAAGVDGIVCSARESSAVKKIVSPSIALAAPGIRPRDYAADDQTRIATAYEAIAAGVDYLIVGRPITQSPSPLNAVKAIQQEVVDALNGISSAE